MSAAYSLVPGQRQLELRNATLGIASLAIGSAELEVKGGRISEPSLHLGEYFCAALGIPAFQIFLRQCITVLKVGIECGGLVQVLRRGEVFAQRRESAAQFQMQL